MKILSHKNSFKKNYFFASALSCLLAIILYFSSLHTYKVEIQNIFFEKEKLMFEIKKKTLIFFKLLKTSN